MEQQQQQQQPQQQQYQQQYQPQPYQQPIVVDTMVKQQAQQVVTTSQVSSVNHEKVVLMGRGLTGAQVHEEAEFVIDGTDAGPGNYLGDRGEGFVKVSVKLAVYY